MWHKSGASSSATSTRQWRPLLDCQTIKVERAERAVISKTTDMNVTLNCPEYDETGEALLASLGFWLEGILQTLMASSGLLCNLISIIVLADKEMRNSFNLMLIALSIFDMGYLIGSILESIRKSFQLMTTVHTYLFPYLLYPGQMIMMTASIFMTVAIAMERYAAVHYPLNYNQAMNDARASLQRVFKYVVPVITLAVLFNIPKFFEAEVLHLEDHENGGQYVELGVTELRRDPVYATYYSSWARLIVTGIIPFLLLVWFNTKIYQDIQFRRKRRCPRPRASKSNSENVEGPFDFAGHRQNSHLLLNRSANCAISMNQSNGLSNGMRRTMEDNLAVIFMGIVGAFLVCHMPRILLSLHEMWIIDDTLKCAKYGRKVFPLWALIFSQISHMLLVTNSSVNSLIYCMLSSRFRKAAIEKAKKWGCIKVSALPSRSLTVINGAGGARETLQIRAQQLSTLLKSSPDGALGQTSYLENVGIHFDKRNCPEEVEEDNNTTTANPAQVSIQSPELIVKSSTIRVTNV